MNPRAIRRRLGPLLGVLFVHVVAITLPAQSMRDPAELLPVGTLAYIGWAGGEVGEFGKQAPHLIAGLKKATNDDEEFAAVLQWVELAFTFWNGRGGLGLVDVGLDPDANPTIELVLVYSAGRSGKSAAEIEAALSSLLGSNDAGSETETQVGDVRFHRSSADAAPLPLHWGVFQDHLIVSTTPKAAEGVVAALRGARMATLAQNQEFALGKKTTGAAAAAENSCTVFINIQRGIEIAKNIATRAEESPPPELDKALKAIGVSALHSLYIDSRPCERGVRTHGFLHADPSAKGLLSLWKQAELSDTELAILPRDAYWANVSNCDLTAFWEATREAIEEIDEQAMPQVEAAIAASRQFLGFSITDDLLPAFGDTWAFFDAPAHGGMLFMGTVLAVDAAKPDAIDGILKRAVQVIAPLAAQNEVNVELRETSIRDRKIHYVVIGGVPSPAAPAWTFAGDRFVFGLWPQAVAAAADQVDPKTRAGSLLDNPQFKAGRALLKPKAISWSYVNCRDPMAQMFPLVQLYGNVLLSMSQGKGGKFDFGHLPNFRDWMAESFDCVGQCTRDDAGFHYVSTGSNSMLALSPGNIAPWAVTASILIPSLSRARELAKRAVCASNLRSIAQGMHIYADDHQEKFPPTLADLVKGGICVPGQFVCPSSDVTEQQAARFFEGSGGKISYVYIAGQGGKDDVRNVLAYEPLENHNGEVACVLFLDGHVEVLKQPRYQEVIRETYKRLKREAEIPAEFR